MNLSRVSHEDLTYSQNLRQDPRRWSYIVVLCSRTNTEHVLQEVSMYMYTRTHTHTHFNCMYRYIHVTQHTERMLGRAEIDHKRGLLKL